LTHVSFESGHVATQRAVDPVLRDQDTTLEAKIPTKSLLPEANGFGILHWREPVVQDHFLEVHALILSTVAQSTKSEHPVGVTVVHGSRNVRAGGALVNATS